MHRHWFFFIVAQASSSCVTTPPKGEAPQALECGAPIRGASALLASGRSLLIGEAHGTVEQPATFGTLICEAARMGLPMRVGLEFPVDDQPALDAFVRAPDQASAHAALMATKDWRQGADGRTSLAMLALVEQLRALKQAGHPLEVFGFSLGRQNGVPRDQRMGEWLAQRLAAPFQGLTLLYVGNIHAALKQQPGQRDVPMAAHLARAGVAFTALTMRSAPGLNWGGFEDGVEKCRAYPLDGTDLGSERFVELTPVRNGVYDGFLYVGAVTASPPAGFPVAPERLQLDREDPMTRRLLGMYAYRRNQFSECGALFSAVAESAKAEGPDAYNAATCHARAGDVDAAFRLLNRAIHLGMPFDAGWSQDEDLAILRQDPRWQQLGG